MRRSLSGSRARFFAVGVGSDARHELLGELTRAGGGQYLRVDEAEQTTDQALRLTSAIKTPTLTDVDVDLDAALDQPFYSATGKLSRGEELVLLARTHHALPPKVTIKGRIAGERLLARVPALRRGRRGDRARAALWAAEYVRRLLGSGATADDNRAKVLDLGITYGLMTPYTSILALDSEAAYARQGVTRRRSVLRGVKLTQLDPSEERELAKQYAGLPSMGGCDKATREHDVGAPAAEPPAQTDLAPQAGQNNQPAPYASAVSTPAPTTAMPVEESDDRAAAQGGLSGLHTSPGGAGGGGRMGPGSGAGASPVSAPAHGAPVLKPPASPPPPAAIAAKPKTASETRDDRQTAKAPPLVLPTTQVAAALARRSLGTCSDAASRPLAERIVLWKKRLTRAQAAGELAVAVRRRAHRVRAARLARRGRAARPAPAARHHRGRRAGAPRAPRRASRTRSGSWRGPSCGARSTRAWPPRWRACSSAARSTGRRSIGSCSTSTSPTSARRTCGR